MILKCETCKQEITDLSVAKTYQVRDDYEQQRSSKDFLKGPHDREYFNSTVDTIYYNCQCGEVTIKSEDVPEIQDFIRDSVRLDPNDLKHEKYGPIRKCAQTPSS
jgi:hypothetical protein